jgi:hypothetical protein
MIRRVALIALAGLVIVTGIWYVAFWGPESSQLKTARTDEAQAETNVVSLTGQLAGIRAELRQLPGERATLALLNQAVPEGPSLDELLKTITAAAAKAHVGLTSIGTPQPAGWGTSAAAQGAAPAGPPTITLSIGITAASNLEILNFVTALETQPRLYVVDSLALQDFAGTGSPASAKGSGKSLTGHSAGASEATNADPVQATSITVQAFYVTASSNDPAALNVSFPAPGGTTKSKSSPSPGASAAELNAAAKAAALRVLLAEQTYERSTGGYLSSASKAAARVLGSPSQLSASPVPVTPGRVAATPGDVLQNGWIPVAATATGRALLVESLAKSGTCFYIAEFLKGATYAGAYAQTTGGCTSNVAFPSGSLSTTAHLVASGSGVHTGDWSRSW